jgi:hypothetical protein
MRRDEWRFVGRLAVALVVVTVLSSTLSQGYMWVLGLVVRYAAGVFHVALRVGPPTISPWVLAAAAVIVAARLDWRRRAVAGAVLVAGALVLDSAAALLSPVAHLPSAVVEQAWTSVSAIVPLVVVIVMANGRPASLWSARASGRAPSHKPHKKTRQHKASKRKH